MTKKRKIHNRIAMTFVEVMIATLIIVPAIIGVLQTFIAVTYLSELTKDNNVAVSHMTNIIEAIKCTPFNLIPANYPDGTIDGPAGNPYASLIERYSLNDEHIVVTYTDPATDPLEILVTLSWRDIRGRQNTRYLTTMRTR